MKKISDNSLIKQKLNLKITSPKVDSCDQAITYALQLLDKKLPINVKALISGSVIIIANGLTESGGEADAKEKKIILDLEKNKLSLQEAEDFLVQEKILNEGDWTVTLLKNKDKKWSCLTYQLVHEFGHIIDGRQKGDSYNRLKPNLSPTKYGKNSPSEAFSEAFTYWILGSKQQEKADQIVISTLNL